MNYSLIIGLSILAVSLSIEAQVYQSNKSLIEQLQSDSPEARTRASQYIFAAGIESEDLYAAVANAIEKQQAKITKNAPKALQQEVAWHTKALATSGNLDYMPLLEELSTSPASTVAKYAKQSKEILATAASSGAPYLDYRKVKVITETQAEGCEYINQRNCSTYRSLDKCIESHKSQASSAGANSIMILHDNKEFGWLKSGMMANYYKCTADQLNNLVSAPNYPGYREVEATSYIDELKALAALRDDGLLTEAEFQKQKAKILEKE